jgi:hypothetical protein
MACFMGAMGNSNESAWIINASERIKQNAQIQEDLRQQAEKIMSACQEDNDNLFELPENSPLERMLL